MKAMILLSGGLDSAVCLWWSKKQGWDLLPLTVNYHLRPAAELRAVRDLLAAIEAGGLVEVPLPFLKDVADLRKEGLQNPREARKKSLVYIKKCSSLSREATSSIRAFWE